MPETLDPDKPTPQSNRVFDCLVLSGGGAKGAYGAGVAKALERFRKLKQIQSHLCYIGTSAGALNAAVLASGGADQLIRFWLSVTNRAVLGVRVRNFKFQALIRWLTRTQPFAIYPNRALNRLISANVSLDSLKDKHVVVATTDYSRGKLKAFYVSDLADTFLDADVKLPIERRRLAHWRKVEDQNTLVRALLASASIPVFFPPVKLQCRVKTDHGFINEAGWYVDGGVGNHTPTREAAYFLRYLEELNLGKAGEVYCVKQDPPRMIEEGEHRFGASDIFKRTLDVYHYLHMEPIIKAWFRINVEVRDHSRRVDRFLEWLQAQNLSPTVLKSISDRIVEGLGTLGGGTGRLSAPMTEIEPQSSLGDTLDFEPRRISEHIKRGYSEMLAVLRHEKKINTTEYDELLNQPVFGGEL